MKLIIDIPDYNLDDIQNGSIACGQILKAVKSGKSYEERPQGKWIKVINPDTNTWTGGLKCSECGRGCVQASMYFCSNCGAKMQIGGAE